MSHKLAVYMCRLRSIQMIEQLKEFNEKEKTVESKKKEQENTKRKAAKGLRHHRLPR